MVHKVFLAYLSGVCQKTGITADICAENKRSWLKGHKGKHCSKGEVARAGSSCLKESWREGAHIRNEELLACSKGPGELGLRPLRKGWYPAGGDIF